MKSIRLLSVGLLAATLGLIGLTGCGDYPKDTPACIGLVIGNRTNSAGVDATAVAATITDPLPVGSTIIITGVSGSATGDAVWGGTVDAGDNSYDRKDNQLNTRNGAIQAVNTVAAKSPQADVLGAIESTADKLRPTGLSCTIYVYDSGLSTAGLIEFQQGENGLLDTDPEDIVARIPETTTLTGFAVSFETLGATSGAQPAPDSTSLQNLTEIWTGIIERRGGKVVPSTHVAYTSVDPQPGLPAVDLVPMPSHTLDFSDLDPTCTPTSTTWVMPSNALFDPDLSELKPQAAALLDQTVQVLQANKDTSILITGHTASTSASPSGMELSEQRAEAVADYLISGGIDESRITHQGVGDTQPSCEDWDPATGTQIPSCAETERNVTLVASGIALCSD